MSLTIKSISETPFSSYSLYRAESYEQVWSGSAVLTNSSGVFVDDAAPDNSLLFYGIECTDSSGNKVRESVINFYHRSDWGPFTTQVVSNLEKTASPYICGGGDTGIVTIPNDVTANMPNLWTTVTQARLDEYQTGAGASMRLLLASKSPQAGLGAVIGGKLLSIRPIVTSSVDLSLMSADSQNFNTASIQMDLYRKYFDELIDGSDIFVVNGYRWKFKLASRKFVEEYLRLFIPWTMMEPTPREFTLTGSSFPSTTLLQGGSDSSTSVLTIATTAPGAMIDDTVVGTRGSYPLLPYFEYLGRE